MCLSGSACEQNSSRTDEPIWTRFSLYMVAYRTGLNPIEIGDLRSKVKVTVTYYRFLLYNSLLTSLLCISCILCPIEMKFGLLLRYALVSFVFEFRKYRIGDDVIVSSFNYDVI